VVTFRTATLGDKPLVGELVKACGKFVRTYSGIRNLDELYRKGFVTVAVVDEVIDEKIVGFAVAPHLIKKPWTSIYEIGVHPDYQRQGIGRAFIVHLANESPYRRLRLVCDARNVNGLHFYTDLGFAAVGKRQNRSGETIFDMAFPG
jgi:ribosomal protein S18 acetylase RimI-like enzyme